MLVSHLQDWYLSKVNTILLLTKEVVRHILELVRVKSELGLDEPAHVILDSPVDVDVLLILWASFDVWDLVL